MSQITGAVTPSKTLKKGDPTCLSRENGGTAKSLRNSNFRYDLSRSFLLSFALLDVKHGNYGKRETEGRGSLMPSYPASESVVNHRVMQFSVLVESFICFIGWQVDTRHG